MRRRHILHNARMPQLPTTAGALPPNADAGRRLKLISFNMQAGLQTHRPRHYVTRGLGHVLPGRGDLGQLQRIGTLLADYDMAGLQETDAGSLRTRGLDQVAVLAEQAGHTYRCFQRNRNFGRLAQHGIALTSRWAPRSLERHPLPGRVRGRSALFAYYGEGEHGLCVAVTHLALGAVARRSQMAYLAERIADQRHVILMGDTNCYPEELLQGPLGSTHLTLAPEPPHTYPSWNPRRAIDHILVSEGFTIHRCLIPAGVASDHLPLAVELDMPRGVNWFTTPDTYI